MKKFLILHSFLLVLVSCSRDKLKLPTNNDSLEMVTNAKISDGTNLVTTIANMAIDESGNITFHFNESQAIFFVATNHSNFNTILSIAKDAIQNKKPIKLSFAHPDILLNLSQPTLSEADAYLLWYKNNLLKVDTPKFINIKKVDSTLFNTLEAQEWQAFARCRKIVPSLTVAKQLFDYCANASCYAGQPNTNPCIPFQYVNNGCFSRAHKMRYIIENIFFYCSEKVFSYGDLKVRADKLGNCCVGWWYHVAPLIRVKVNTKTYCYVIDPSMFNQPVPLSTWLAAQENTSCSTSALVSTYSIQPSDAYTPAGYGQTTSFTTDPDYTLTNASLLYHNTLGQSCVN
jgi:Glutaminase